MGAVKPMTTGERMQKRTRCALSLALLTAALSARAQHVGPSGLTAPSRDQTDLAAAFSYAQAAVEHAQLAAKEASTDAKKSPFSYSREDARANAESQTSVFSGRTQYFIDHGDVFEKNLDTSKVARVPHAEYVQAILLFKNALVALQTDGNIWIRHPFAEEWLRIGTNARRILATDEDLIAVTSDGGLPLPMHLDELWIYKGKPADSGVLGRDAAFYDVGLRGVARVEPKNVSGRRDIEITFRDGRTALFSEIRASLPRP
jgi:hypothetical protein